jgi:hypothetical protein
MKAEKVILSFVAIFVGLIAAGIAFYLYQMTKTVPAEKTKDVVTNTKVTPSVLSSESDKILTVDTPKDEDVFNKKLITINGRTISGATIIVSTETGDEVVTPAKNGNFSLTQTIPDGTSLITITAVFPNGEEKRITRTVTFSTESF